MDKFSYCKKMCGKIGEKNMNYLVIYGLTGPQFFIGALYYGIIFGGVYVVGKYSYKFLNNKLTKFKTFKN